MLKYDQLDWIIIHVYSIILVSSYIFSFEISFSSQHFYSKILKWSIVSFVLIRDFNNNRNTQIFEKQIFNFDQP